MDAICSPVAMRTMVVGLGVTGLSVAHYLSRRNEPFVVWDIAPKEQALAKLHRDCPNVSVRCGDPSPKDFESADMVIVSPGVSLDHPALRAARAGGAQVYGDIELFAHEANAPVIGITGSNGKSTTTLLLAHLLEAGGADIAFGGNLGTPALSLLREPAPDAYVLELSSFQLEATETLHCRAASLLNLSPDHIDRHGSFEVYREIKHRLYRYTEVAVFNRDDSNTRPGITAGRTVSFGLDIPSDDGDFGIREHVGQPWLCRGRVRLSPCAEIPLAGRHNWANALAALAMADAYGLPIAQAALDLHSFKGLPHRLQKVSEFNGVSWYNDSKATNISALRAALSAFDRPCVLIAGGRGKKEDLTRIAPLLTRRARALVLFGESAEAMAGAWGGGVPTVVVTSLADAVPQAAELARPGDCVLLSPGCASFDQYAGFEERGEDFTARVRTLEQAS